MIEPLDKFVLAAGIDAKTDKPVDFVATWLLG